MSSIQMNYMYMYVSVYILLSLNILVERSSYNARKILLEVSKVHEILFCRFKQIEISRIDNGVHEGIRHKVVAFLIYPFMVPQSARVACVGLQNDLVSSNPFGRKFLGLICILHRNSYSRKISSHTMPEIVCIDFVCLFVCFICCMQKTIQFNLKVAQCCICHHNLLKLIQLMQVYTLAL